MDDILRCVALKSLQRYPKIGYVQCGTSAIRAKLARFKRMQAPVSQRCQYYESPVAWEKIRRFASPVVVFAINHHSRMYSHKQTPTRTHTTNKHAIWPRVHTSSFNDHRSLAKPHGLSTNQIVQWWPPKQYLWEYPICRYRTENTIHNNALIKSNNELGRLIYLIMPCCGDKLDKWEWRNHHHHRRHNHHHDEDYDDDDDDDDHNDDHDHDSDNMTKVMIMMRRMTIMLMTTTAVMSQNVSQ